MDIFGIGTGELIAIFLIAILVLGPERMILMARQLGRAIRQARIYLAQIDREVPPELKEVREAVTELRSAGTQLRTELAQKLVEPPPGRAALYPRPPQAPAAATEPAPGEVILPGPPPPEAPSEPPPETAPAPAPDEPGESPASWEAGP